MLLQLHQKKITQLPVAPDLKRQCPTHFCSWGWSHLRIRCRPRACLCGIPPRKHAVWSAAGVCTAERSCGHRPAPPRAGCAAPGLEQGWFLRWCRSERPVGRQRLRCKSATDLRACQTGARTKTPGSNQRISVNGGVDACRDFKTYNSPQKTNPFANEYHQSRRQTTVCAYSPFHGYGTSDL